MKQKNIDIIAGARPNFMKVSALFAVKDQFPELNLRLIHTGQHYDPLMSTVFLEEFGLPKPVCNLEVGSASHAIQTAEIMRAYEQWILDNKPDLCVVVGDVNSTIACALTVAKFGISIAHVEAGLRSFDRTMPEEINRILTDSISDLLFVTEPSGIVNLKNEGHPEEKIFHVGHVMIDTLLRMKSKAEQLRTCEKFSMKMGKYAFVTLHRPANVDNEDTLRKIIEQLLWLSEKTPIVFPLHPRTKKRLMAMHVFDVLCNKNNMSLIEPVGYLESLSLMMNSEMVITDSGGIQEETTALAIPCLTLRQNTERPITIQQGTNTLIGDDVELFKKSVETIRQSKCVKKLNPIPYWDGNSGRRILKEIKKYLGV